MRLPQVRLQSQPALISIQQQDAHVEINQPGATQQIEQPTATVRMRTIPSRLTIDQTQAWHDMDLKSAKVRIAEAAQQGKQKVLQGISRRINQGNQLMKIEHGGNPIVSQAVTNGHRPEKQFNIGWIPSHFAVKTDYRPAEVDINVTTRQPNIQHQANKPTLQYQPGAVITGIRQQSDLQVDFEHLYFQGMHFEMKL